MRTKEAVISLTDTSPSAASTVVSSAIVFKGTNHWRCEYVVIDALITGGTGGTLDVYLQRKTGTNAWLDWCHFPQVAAAGAKKFTLVVNGYGILGANTIFDVGTGTDVAATPSLAANTFVNCPPGGDVRAVFVAGAGTSAGASQTITLTPYSTRD